MKLYLTEGWATIALTDYNQIVICEDHSNMASSPKWHKALNEFAADYLMDKPCGIYNINILSSSGNDGIVIRPLGYKLIKTTEC